METTNRIIWKNTHMKFEDMDIRNLFVPIMLAMVPARRVGETIWTVTRPRNDQSILGFARASIKKIEMLEDKAHISYEGKYESGNATLWKAMKGFSLYIQRNEKEGGTEEDRESALERLAGSSPFAKVPIIGY